MKLELDPSDLRPEFQQKVEGGYVTQKCNIEEITYEMFSNEAQNALWAAGHGVFYSRDRETSKDVYAKGLQIWKAGSRVVRANEINMVFDSNVPWSSEEIDALRSSQLIRYVKIGSAHSIQIEPAFSGELKDMAVTHVQAVVLLNRILSNSK